MRISNIEPVQGPGEPFSKRVEPVFISPVLPEKVDFEHQNRDVRVAILGIPYDLFGSVIGRGLPDEKN